MSKDLNFIAGLSGCAVYVGGSTFNSENVKGNYKIRGVQFASFPAIISVASSKIKGELTDIRDYLNCTNTKENIIVSAPSPFFKFPFNVDEFKCDVDCTLIIGEI